MGLGFNIRYNLFENKRRNDQSSFNFQFSQQKSVCDRKNMDSKIEPFQLNPDLLSGCSKNLCISAFLRMLFLSIGARRHIALKSLDCAMLKLFLGGRGR